MTRSSPRHLALALLMLLACLAAPAGAQEAAASKDPLALHFSDFFQSPSGSTGLQLSPTLLQANGQTVRLTGYMVQQEQAARGRFMFTPRPVRMSEHADGDADDLPAAWVMVYLEPAQQDFAIAYQRGLMELRGVLDVGRLEEQDGRVSWVRLRLDAQATRGMNAFELANYLHAQQHLH